MKIKFSTTTTGDNYYGYALKAEVVDPGNMPPDIFVFHAGVPELPGKEVVDTFSHVASPVDLEELPAKEPDFSKKTPFYRRSSVTLWVRSSEWIDQLKSNLDSDIALLVRDYGHLNDENNYKIVEEKNYG